MSEDEKPCSRSTDCVKPSPDSRRLLLQASEKSGCLCLTGGAEQPGYIRAVTRTEQTQLDLSQLLDRRETSWEAREDFGRHKHLG
jgi:hypothetical protein